MPYGSVCLGSKFARTFRTSSVHRTSLFVRGTSQKFRDWGNTKLLGLPYSKVGYVPFRIVLFELHTRRRAPLPLPETPQYLEFRDAVQYFLRFSFNLRDALCSSSFAVLSSMGKSRCLNGLDRGSGRVGYHHHVCFDYKFPKPCELARCHNAGDRHG
jgi:hypothetical protein